MNALCDMVMEHAKKRGFAAPRWNADYYRGPFARFHIETATKRLIWPKEQDTTATKGRKKRVHSTWAIGVEVASITDDGGDAATVQADADADAVIAPVAVQTSSSSALSVPLLPPLPLPPPLPLQSLLRQQPQNGHDVVQ